MAKSLDLLLKESGDFIEARINAGLSKTAAATQNSDDDVFKLAEQLRGASEASVEGEGPLLSLTEKIANARAITETFVNLPLLQKLDALEKAAAAEGFSEDDLTSFMEKKAAALPFRNIFELMGEK